MSYTTQNLVAQVQSAYRIRTGRLFDRSDILGWFNRWNRTIEAKAQIPARLTEATLTTDTTGRATLPSDFHSLAVVQIGSTIYRQADLEAYAQTKAVRPVYALFGTQIILPAVSTSVELTYYQTLTDFTDTNLAASLPVPDSFAPSYVSFALARIFERDKEFELSQNYERAAEQALTAADSDTVARQDAVIS